MSHPVVDAHQHFWDPAQGGYAWLAEHPDAIRRRFDVDDLRPHLARNGVDGTVLVQADDSDADTDAMFALAADHPEIWGVVGYVPLEQPARAAERLAELATRERFVGVRNLIHDQPDPDWLLRADVADGLGLLEQADLPFDLVAVLPRHLEHVDYLSDRFPGLRIVIDHLSKPPIKSATAGPWETLIRRAATHPQVHAKVSGLYPAVGDWADHSVDDLRRWVDAALEAFGPDRLMIGSDWPVSVLAGGYDRVWSELVELLRGYGGEVAEAVLGRTATTFYGLTPR
jgi:L-fuconolactonase